jgi:two-component system response regulator
MNDLSILIAEDDADDRFLLQKALEESGNSIKVHFVENGIELFMHLDNIKKGKVSNKYPRFILLDLNMPKMDGHEVLKKIKADNELKKIPVIIFSTTRHQLEVKMCYDLGANTYIVKPSNFNLLVATIHQIRTYWFETATLADAV